MSAKKLCAVVMFVLVFSAAYICYAQESAAAAKTATQSETADTTAKSPERRWEVYRVDFSIIELEDGKKINVRQYSTNVGIHEPSEIRIGTRVPVDTKEGEFQYLDLGTNISARIQEDRSQMALIVHAEVSELASPEQSDKPGYRPMIRQLKIGGTTPLPLEKPTIVGRADDPGSKRQFQLEVTVTKLN
jgi:hypothetical protein